VPQEIELKLAVDPRDVRRLRESPILRAPGLKHTARQRLVSTYYDTPSFSLQRSGVILRVRKIGRERVQSVKMNAAESGGLARRIELESLIRSDRPDPMRIADPECPPADSRALSRQRSCSYFCDRCGARDVASSAGPKPDRMCN
jgi:inorganic triphosphatase YgiF